MRENNIFYKLTSENENATTELLCNLCGNDEYRKIILSIMGLDDFPIDFEDIDTQAQIPKKRKRPDIIIENKNVKIFIENKINMNYSLLKSQTKIYPEELCKTEKRKKMIYLIPENHKSVETINELFTKYDFISLVYWEKLINELEKYNKIKKSEILNESIKYFNNILNMIPKTIFLEEDIVFMNDIDNFRREINTMAKEAELFSNVIEKLHNNLKLSFSQKEPLLVCDPDAFGYYFCKENCFLGYSFALLDYEKQEEKDFFLSLAIHKDGVKAKIKDFNIYPYFFDDEWYFFKFEPNIFSNDEKEKLLAEYCTKILQEVLKV